MEPIGPIYCTSFDAAWEIIAHFAMMDGLTHKGAARKSEFMRELDFVPCNDCPQPHGSILQIRWWTPEKICIAALRAEGYLVIL